MPNPTSMTEPMTDPMTDPFVHLHVASGYSLQHGASHPEALVERAAEHGMDALALTDRDGVYGAVKFAKACLQAGIRPILGVDLAVEPPAILSFLQAAPGGSQKKPQDRARTGVGAARRAAERRWTCGSRGSPRSRSAGRVGPRYAGSPAPPICVPNAASRSAPSTCWPSSTADLYVLLGPHSDVGAAVAARRFDLAHQLLARWRSVVPGDRLLLEVVSHRGPLALSSAHAARMLGFAAEQRLPAVLTNLVRYADRDGATTADVLDAARRLVALDARHIDRTNAEGFLKSGEQMAALAAEVAGPDRAAAYRLLRTTREVAERAMLDPHADLGLGSVHFPELEIVGASNDTGDTVLRHRAEAGLGRRGMALTSEVAQRLDAELEVIAKLGYANYFLTVADVVDLIRDMGVRVAARGSGAGSLVNYLLGISGVDPMAHGLLMERFLSPLRQALPDIDVDVESARRTEVYERILARYGGERCACVSMMDTYRVRHAIRDVGAALGLPLGEIDTLAKAFPHIRARDAKAALRELPELRASNIGGALSKDAAGADARLDLLFTLVERLDGLPRHVALHPCGVLLSDATLLDRTPVEASYLGFPMSQFDKDDVEDLGLLKLDVLGIRMQSAMAHALDEVRRVDQVEPPDIDEIPLDDPQTFALIQSTHTLGCFQIESPGQRELVGKFGPETFGDIITDISLFRPGPVKSDMVTPFLRARQGWEEPVYLHPDLVPALEETCGVVVFHEQVLLMLAAMTGCSLAEADEVRRELGSFDQQPVVREWFYTATLRRGYDLVTVERVWDVLKAFASFGFCKAHAAAFALPTYQSAYLKAHHPAAFMAGVLTHDPGMYPKRLILDDVRQMGIAVLGLDVNLSDAAYRVEKVAPWDPPPPGILGAPPRAVTSVPGVPDARDYGIRLALSEVKGIDEAEVARIVAGRPYASLTDFWHRARVARPVVERLVVAGAFDSLYGLSSVAPVRRRGQVTRRDLLLQVADLDRWSKPAPGARNRRARVRPDAEAGGVRSGCCPTVTGRDGGHRARRAAHPPALRRRSRIDAHLGAARHDHRRTGQGRAGDPRSRREPARRRLLLTDARCARHHPLARPGALPLAAGGARRRGQGRDPDPADPLRPPGRVPHPRRLQRSGRRDVLRGRARSLLRDRLPLLAARGARVRATHRPARGVDPGDGGVGDVRAVRCVGGRRHTGGAVGARG